MSNDDICSALLRLIADDRKCANSTCEMKLNHIDFDCHWFWIEIMLGGTIDGNFEYTTYTMPMSKTENGAKEKFLDCYCRRNNIGSIEELILKLIAKGYIT